MQLPRLGPYEFRPLGTTRLDLFECDPKLERYFREDALDSENELIAKHFFLCHENFPDIPLAGLSLSNNAIEACPEVDMTLVRSAQYRVYPAVLIGRFAVHKNHVGQGHGRFALDLLKTWFITANKTGCRFIIVESRPEAAEFYRTCGFEDYPVQREKSETLLLYFDLKAYLSSLKRATL